MLLSRCIAALCFVLLFSPPALANCPLNTLQNQANDLATCPALRLDPILNDRCPMAALADWLDDCPKQALQQLSKQCQGKANFNCQDIQNNTCLSVGQQLLYKKIQFSCDYLYYLAHPELIEQQSLQPATPPQQSAPSNNPSVRYRALPLN